MNNSFFITGTDTHIGKTEITCALIEFLIDNEILNIKGLGNYDTFTHIDIRDEKARW